MITVRRLNGAEVTINAELIEAVEAAPDTVISLSTGNRYVVREPIKEVIARIIEYRKQINAERKDPIQASEQKR